MDTFPAFFPLAGRRVVIAGEGEPAEAKARLFEGSPAEVVRVTGEAAFGVEAYAGAWLVFVASLDRAFQDRAAAAARSCGAPLNVVDRPDLADFNSPALVDRGALVVAVGTNGAAPVLASLLRAQFETQLSPGLTPLTALLAQRRPSIRDAFPELGRRRAFFRGILSPNLAELAQQSPKLAGEVIDRAIRSGDLLQGYVSFVVRPPVEDLISVRAARELSAADVVVTEPDEILVERHARRDAERRLPVEAKPEWLIATARSGLRIAVIGPEPESDLLSELGELASVHRPAPWS